MSKVNPVKIIYIQKIYIFKYEIWSMFGIKFDHVKKKSNFSIRILTK